MHERVDKTEFSGEENYEKQYFQNKNRRNDTDFKVIRLLLEFQLLTLEKVI